MKTILQTYKLRTSLVNYKQNNSCLGRKLTKVGCCFFSAFLTVYLTGCATVPLSIKPEEAQDIKKVAIVSILEDDFDWIAFDLLVWNWKRGTHKISEWGIDASAEKAARQAIGEMSHYSIIDISKARGELLLATKKEQNMGRKLTLPDATPLLQALGKKYHIDALIVISRGKSQHFPLTGRTVAIGGNGIAKEMTMRNLGTGRIALYSTVTVDVYSVNTLKIIASNQGFRWIHVDQALFDECVVRKGPTWDNGLKTTVANMVNAAVCDGIRYTRLTHAPGQPNSSAQPSEQAHQGVIPTGNRLNKITIGMSMKDVYDQLGQPTGAVLYYTKKAFTPFYAGADQARFDALYRNEGRITFSGAGPSGFLLRVLEVKQDPKEGGYDEQHNRSMPIYRIGREECLNVMPQ
jgi:hypothetical protein